MPLVKCGVRALPLRSGHSMLSWQLRVRCLLLPLNSSPPLSLTLENSYLVGFAPEVQTVPLLGGDCALLLEEIEGAAPFGHSCKYRMRAVSSLPLWAAPRAVACSHPARTVNNPNAVHGCRRIVLYQKLSRLVPWFQTELAFTECIIVERRCARCFLIN